MPWLRSGVTTPVPYFLQRLDHLFAVTQRREHPASARPRTQLPPSTIDRLKEFPFGDHLIAPRLHLYLDVGEPEAGWNGLVEQNGEQQGRARSVERIIALRVTRLA